MTEVDKLQTQNTLLIVTYDDYHLLLLLLLLLLMLFYPWSFPTFIDQKYIFLRLKSYYLKKEWAQQVI